MVALIMFLAAATFVSCSDESYDIAAGAVAIDQQVVSSPPSATPTDDSEWSLAIVDDDEAVSCFSEVSEIYDARGTIVSSEINDTYIEAIWQRDSGATCIACFGPSNSPYNGRCVKVCSNKPRRREYQGFCAMQDFARSPTQARRDWVAWLVAYEALPQTRGARTDYDDRTTLLCDRCIATYYLPVTEGHPTKSKEPHFTWLATAAHQNEKRLGISIRIRNPANGAAIEARLNDTMPSEDKDRSGVYDLSWEAMKRLSGGLPPDQVGRIDGIIVEQLQ